MKEDDGLTSYERMLKQGQHPCAKCIWFKGEVSVLCENHQHLVETIPPDPDTEGEDDEQDTVRGTNGPEARDD